MTREWCQDAVVYEVYPRSFADTSGNGTGDLPGVTSRLPYLADLGVDAIWLTPFYPSPLADGGYDVSDYTGVDPRLGTLTDFDTLVGTAAAHGIRVLVDLVPNHCSAEHPLFRAAMAARPGSPERDLFLFRDGLGGDGGEPPNNWRSAFGGPAWTRVTEMSGAPGQWYLHSFDATQPDWNWRHPAVAALFEHVIRFWLDRGVAGFRVDVANGLFKDPALPDTRPGEPSPCWHRPELHGHYPSWRAILDSYPASGFPGRRTAIGEVWYDAPGKVATLLPYLAGGGLPQVFNFQMLLARWDAAELRAAVEAGIEITGGSGPWLLGSHDAVRPATRLAPCDDGVPDLAAGSRRARAAALLQLALPGPACVFQGEELGLPEVLDLPAAARADPAFRRSGGAVRGRDGCRVPLPWSGTSPPYGFSDVAVPGGTWLPQPDTWAGLTVRAQRAGEGSFLNLYRAALRLRRRFLSPAGGQPAGLRWADEGPLVLAFTRGDTFRFVANLGTAPVSLPPEWELILASGPLRDGYLPADTAAWLTQPPTC